MRFERDRHIFSSCGRIIYNGFSSFIVDIAMGVLTILFNRSILQYLNTDALAVYGVIVSVSTFVQCCAYGVGRPLSRYFRRITAQISLTAYACCLNTI